MKKIAQVVGLQNAPPVDYNPWQDFQRWLGIGERRVVVPFADALADLMEALAVRLRRDFGQVLAAIQAHALLHRGQRDRDESGRIVADIDHDYAAIRELMSAIVAEGTGADIKKEMAETIKAVAEATVGMEKTEGATAKEVGKILKLDRSAAWRRLAATCDEGFCINLETRKGMAGKYRTTGQQIEPIVVLPSVEDLAKKHAHSSLCPPSKTAEPCNRDEIDQSTQVDDGCKLCNRHATKQLEEPGRLHGCKPVANGLATDNSLNSKVKSPPVARFADFPGGIEREEEGARAFRSDVEDAKEELREREAETPICAHCGRPGGEAFAFGEFFAEALHPRCRHDWLVAQGADMDL